MEHENEQEQEQVQRQEQERVQAQGLRPRVARVSAAVAVERIDKTLGTLPKLKQLSGELDRNNEHFLERARAFSGARPRLPPCSAVPVFPKN